MNPDILKVSPAVSMLIDSIEQYLQQIMANVYRYQNSINIYNLATYVDGSYSHKSSMISLEFNEESMTIHGRHGVYKSYVYADPNLMSYVKEAIE